VTACRLYVLTAPEAATALVLRRGPTRWWHLLEWDLAHLTLTPGAWFHGTLYPRRCDISPDGRLFGYFAMKGSFSQPSSSNPSSSNPSWPGEYFAVSRSPWLQALAGWQTCGTWTWGCRFSATGHLEIRACMHREPFHGGYPGGFSAESMSTDWKKRDVWNELKRGWEIAADNVPATGLALRRAQPGGGGVSLGLIHLGVDFKRPGMEGVQLEYFLQDNPRDVTPLPQAVWADWDREGRLLMATRSGALEVHRCHGAKLHREWSEDLRDRTPDPRPAPAWASGWR